MSNKELEKLKKEITSHFDKTSDETKRHFDVMTEDLSSQMKGVAEMVAQNTEDITAIRTDIEIIKQHLRIKVDIADFEALERRVSMLEKKRN